MDDDQVLDEGKNTQSKESLSREETGDSEQQLLQYVHQLS